MIKTSSLSKLDKKVDFKISSLLYFLKPYYLQYFAILCVGVFLGVLESLNLALFLPIFTGVLGLAEIVSDGKLMKIINVSIGLIPFKDKIISACILLISVTFIKTMFGFINESLIAYMSGRVMYDVRKRVIEKYFNASYQYFLDNKQGDLIFRANLASNKISGILLNIPKIVTGAIMVLSISVLLLYINIKLTFGLTVLGMLYGGLIVWLSRKYIYPLGRKSANMANQLVAIVTESLVGIKHIFVNNSINKWERMYDKTNKEASRIYALNDILIYMPQNILQFFAYGTMAFVIIVFRHFLPNEFLLLLPSLGVFAIGFQRIMPLLIQLSNFSMRIIAELPLCEVVYSTLNEKSEHSHPGKKDFVGFNDSIVFNSVDFSHKERGKLLEDVNIEFKKNQITAIVGASGAGKTTIINLLLGLFYPSTGKILIDGIDQKEYDLSSLLQKIGFVSQEPFIFHSTIADNIAFSYDSDNRKELVEAAELAHAHEFIMNFPDGYQTIVGERGMKLSGGQQQRIAIARAIFRKPEIFIFDEATSSLDNVSEKLIQDSINMISKDKTVIIVAHRLSTIQKADKIFVLKDGRIAEQGTFFELFNKESHFKNLYKSEVVKTSR